MKTQLTLQEMTQLSNENLIVTYLHALTHADPAGYEIANLRHEIDNRCKLGRMEYTF